MGQLLEIYEKNDLQALIHDQKITQSFWVNSTSVNKLHGVKEILSF